jgi:hypothetical protein
MGPAIISSFVKGVFPLRSFNLAKINVMEFLHEICIVAWYYNEYDTCIVRPTGRAREKEDCVGRCPGPVIRARQVDAFRL